MFPKALRRYACELHTHVPRPYTPEEEPGQTDNPAGPFGDPNCNTPVALEESMYAAINELVPDVDFAIFTGDMIDSAVWNTSRPYNEDISMPLYLPSRPFANIFAFVANPLPSRELL